MCGIVGYLSNTRELAARCGELLPLSNRPSSELPPTGGYAPMPDAGLERFPLLRRVPMQLWSCERAAQQTIDADRPRNLVKTVTVE